MAIQDQREHCKQIYISDGIDNDETIIQQKEVSKAHKTLGCYKAINGNEIDQVKYLKERSDKFGYSLKNASLTRKQAKMAYKMVYIPSLKYGLPACSLKPKQIDNIQNFTIDKFLLFMGFEHGSKQFLIHGPSEMGGANIPHLYTEMMGMKLEAFISHIRAKTVLGQSFTNNLNYIQLIAGIEEPIFESREDISYLEDNWILHLRDYLLEINGSLQIDDLWLPKKLRDNDVNLMKAFKNLQLTKSELRLINNWRIYFQVNYLSEICNPEGNKIQKCFLKSTSGLTMNQDNESSLRWPVQKRPGKKGFGIWMKCLQYCFNMQSNGRITHNLGNWKSLNITQQYSKWQYYFQPSTLMVFYRQDDYYVSIVPEITRKTTAKFNSSSKRYHHNKLPQDCIPAEIVAHKNNVRIAKFHASIILGNKHGAKITEWSDPIISNLDIVNEDKLVLLAKDNSKPISIISDGGVYNYEGTYGLVTSDGQAPIASNNGKLYSVDFFETSFRSEMYSMLAGIISLVHINKQYNIESAEPRYLHLYSDNKTLIKKLNKREKVRRTVIQHRDSDVDLELQLLHELRQLEDSNYIISMKHVKSHQELIKSKAELSHEETMNVLADKLTKDARKYKSVSKYEKLPQNPISLTINNAVINS